MSAHIYSAFDYVPPIIPSTKPKQRMLLERGIRKLSSDPYVLNTYWEVILDFCHIKHELYNRQPVARGQVTALSVTPFMITLVKHLHRINPDWNYEQLARATGLDNIGRISEILAGVRT